MNKMNKMKKLNNTISFNLFISSFFSFVVHSSIFELFTTPFALVLYLWSFWRKIHYTVLDTSGHTLQQCIILLQHHAFCLQMQLFLAIIMHFCWKYFRKTLKMCSQIHKESEKNQRKCKEKLKEKWRKNWWKRTTNLKYHWMKKWKFFRVFLFRLIFFLFFLFFAEFILEKIENLKGRIWKFLKLFLFCVI